MWFTALVDKSQSTLNWTASRANCWQVASGVHIQFCLFEYCCKFSHCLHLSWTALVPGMGKLFPCKVELQESLLVTRLPSWLACMPQVTCDPQTTGVLYYKAKCCVLCLLLSPFAVTNFTSINNLFSISWSLLILLKSVLSHLFFLYFSPSFTILFSKPYPPIFVLLTTSLSSTQSAKCLSPYPIHSPREVSILKILPVQTGFCKLCQSYLQQTNGILDPYSPACWYLVWIYKHGLYGLQMWKHSSLNSCILEIVLHTWQVEFLNPVWHFILRKHVAAYPQSVNNAYVRDQSKKKSCHMMTFASLYFNALLPFLISIAEK